MGLPVPNYPDYTIETDGRIYSKKSNRWLKASLGNNGYYGIELRNVEGHKRLSIHRLVALTYIPNPNNLPFVNHKDEDKTNNNASNLEWCTHQYNITYGSTTKRRVLHTDYSKPSYKENAIKNGKRVSKPTLQIDDNGKIIQRFESAKEASRVTGISHSHILECCHGKRYKRVGGYHWQFERGNDLSAFQY